VRGGHLTTYDTTIQHSGAEFPVAYSDPTIAFLERVGAYNAVHESLQRIGTAIGASAYRSEGRHTLPASAESGLSLCVCLGELR
jgi:hypothetical protein